MSGQELSSPAWLVRELDPDLFHAALFAPEPVRERLMVLYAYDIELSRAAAKAAGTAWEPLIARMRLQWWREVITGITAGAPPMAHDVAGPLHGLLTAHALPADDLAALADARELELHGVMDEHRFNGWLDGRFAALTRLAVHLQAGGNAAARRAASTVGLALGTSFALHQAVPLAAEVGLYPLPGLGPEDRVALARGRTTAHARATAHRLADQALAMLAAARAERRGGARGGSLGAAAGPAGRESAATGAAA